MTPAALALIVAIGAAGVPGAARAAPQETAAGKAKKNRASRQPPKDTPTATPSPDAPLDAEAPPAAGGPHFVWKQHPSLRFGKALRLDFQAKFQGDGRRSYEGAVRTARLQPWELHRSRVGIEGRLFRHVAFEVERELKEKELSDRDALLGLSHEPAWKDANVDVDYIENLQIRAGRFKVPFGLDTLTGVSQNDFVYRSLGATYLTPSRDAGVMAHGRFFKRGLNYWTGLFAHDGDNARSKKIQGGDLTFAARATALPLRRAFPGRFGAFATGGSLAISRVSDDSFRPNGIRGRTVVTQDTFYEPVYVKGRRVRWAADLDWTLGPGSLRSEYTHVRDERRGQGFADEALPDARHRAWYVSGTWLVTRDLKARPVRPAADFPRGGIGAVELAARFERIWFDSVDKSDEPFADPRAFTIQPTGDKVWTLGVNWSVNRFVKLQFNAIREQIERPERNPVPNGAAFWSQVTRLQLVL